MNSIYVSKDTRFPAKLFLALVQHFGEVAVTLDFHFFCAYCRSDRVLQLPKKYDPPSITPSSFQSLFVKLRIAAVLPYMSLAEYKTCDQHDWLWKLYYCNEEFNTAMHQGRKKLYCFF